MINNAIWDSNLAFLNTPLQIGKKTLPNRLIQGPLAGFSCAPFRELFYQFLPPAYCVSEMLSARDVVNKHNMDSRYLYRGKIERTLCYQIAGNEALIMADAAIKLEDLGADLIDINCGCPKTKIRKKGAGSALLENPTALEAIIVGIKSKTQCPITVKIRLQQLDADLVLAKLIENAGADALIIHGRHWLDDYTQPCNLEQIARIKTTINIPVIANGDIADYQSALKVLHSTGCDGLMISRAGMGRPWLYQELLTSSNPLINHKRLVDLFLTHLENLSQLENEYKAVLQSKTFVRYYFRDRIDQSFLAQYYQLTQLDHAVNLIYKLSGQD